MSTRNTCFTLNNYSTDEYNDILNWSYSYLIIGKEVGSNGTPHLQGYIEWGNPKRFSTLKNLNPRIHWENRKGSAEQAAKYCMKDGDYIERGERSQQGKRTDLDIACEMIIDKTPMKDIAIANPSTYVKYHKGLEKLKFIIQEDRTEAPKVFWRWGKSGVGKTRYCVDKHPDHYIKDGTPWWDGYEHQEAIIIDDFCGLWPFRDLLRLLDRYAYQGQVKGGYVKINSPYIYITCEYHPTHFWSGNELDQVMRRVTDVTEVAGNTNAATCVTPLLSS